MDNQVTMEQVYHSGKNYVLILVLMDNQVTNLIQLTKI